MKLKIEQKLFGFNITESKPEIYTTGAKLVPLKVDINGKEKYLWVVEEFKDDTYLDGENCSVNVIADKQENLIIKDE